MNLGGFTVAQFAEGARRFGEVMRACTPSVRDFVREEPDDTPPDTPDS